MPIQLLATVVLLATLLTGCSDKASTNGPAQPDAEAEATTDATPVVPDAVADAPPDQAAGDAAACICSAVDDAGVSLTSKDCVCRSSDSCQDYAASVAALCSNNVVYSLTVSSFTGCNVKRIQYVIGASSTSALYDATTGAFLGARYDDDIRGRCPGTSQMIGFSLAIGTYELPASCQPAGQTHPCEHGDAGPDSAIDGAPGDASSE